MVGPTEFFDYANLDDVTRLEIQLKHAEINEIIKERGFRSLTAQQTILVGQKLEEVQNQLKGSGRFLDWLTSTSLKTAIAYNIIRTAKIDLWKTLKSEELNLIPTSSLYDLSARSVSDEARLAVIELLKAGQPITISIIKEIIESTANKLSSFQLSSYTESSFDEIFRRVSMYNLIISKKNLRRYHLALKTRGFAILSGISGTGKTWLTQAYAEVVGAEYCLVPVAPNWTTNEDLLGYFNPITEKYCHTEFSRFVLAAAEEYGQAEAEGRDPQPYHLVLDEMNLARVEYYFAKFLSAMEVRIRDKSAAIELSANEQALLTPNLYFIGTINVDETTHGFADKVYDRAQLIELTVDRQQLADHLGEVVYREILLHIWDEVHAVAPFAFRVLDEITTYIEQAEAIGTSWEEALDEQLLQKILPKFKGADQRVGVALKAFAAIAQDKGFSLSHAKASWMLKNFDEHGFTSYF